MNNPIQTAALAPGTVMRGERGEVMKEAPPFERDPSRQLTIHEYTSIRNSQNQIGDRLGDKLFAN